MVKITGLGWIGNRDRFGPGLHYGGSRLHEEEWRLAVRVLAHFAGMRRIVAAHAEDAVDGKTLAAACDGKRIGWCWLNCVFHVGLQVDQLIFSSRHRPRPCCTGRSEKLNRIVSRRACSR